MSFDPEFRGPTGYKSKKRRVIPNRRHWYRGWWHSLNRNYKRIERVPNPMTEDERLEHMRRMLHSRQ